MEQTPKTLIVEKAKEKGNECGEEREKETKTD